MFAHDPQAAAQVIAAVRRGSEVPVFAKLSPNVTSLTEIAAAVIQAGASGVSLINTVLAMAVDIQTGRPKLAGEVGGLSGPAIKPIAVRSVFEIHREFPHIPIIGMGGIMDWRDAVEFVMAGATAVALGTVNFINPRAATEVTSGMREFCRRKGVRRLEELRGQVKIEG